MKTYTYPTLVVSEAAFKEIWNALKAQNCHDGTFVSVENGAAVDLTMIQGKFSYLSTKPVTGSTQSPFTLFP